LTDFIVFFSDVIIACDFQRQLGQMHTIFCIIGKKHAPAIILVLIAGIGIGLGAAPIRHQEALFSLVYDHSMHRDDIALIIPGMHQTNRNRGYDSIAGFYETRGITPVMVNITWKKVGLQRLSEVARQIDTMIRDSFPDAHIFLFGFSFGAAIALKVAQTLPAEHILLCSMSPVFSEDRSALIFPFRKMMGMVTDYATNGLSYAANRKMCIFFLYGDHDNVIFNKAVINHRQSFFTCATSTIVNNGHHDISSRHYLQEIKRIVQGIM
jgi:predicted esterase